MGSKDIKWTGVYVFEWPLREFHGTLSFNDTLGKNTVGAYWYYPSSISDPLYNLTGYLSNPVKIIYDRIKVIDGGISSSSVTVNQPVTVWFKAVYEYDNEPFNDSKGDLLVNGEEMKWSTANQRWEKEFTSSQAKKLTFEVSGVHDHKYNLNAINTASKTISVEWTSAGIPGYPLLGIAAGFLLAAMFLIYFRKH